MIGGLRFFKRKKENNFLVLDIGSEAIKTLAFQEKEGKLEILGNSMEYFDSAGVFESWNFEQDVLEKTILRTIRDLNLSPNQTIDGLMRKNNPEIILGLPGIFLKAKIVSQNIEREKGLGCIKKEEEKLIHQQVSNLAEKEIIKIYTENQKILPTDIKFLSFKIIETKIDGYPVPFLAGYKGRKLDFRILITFVFRTYLERIEGVCQKLSLRKTKIFHPSEGLTFCLKDKKEKIFLDIGGGISQVFLTRNGNLEGVDDFGAGGKLFSKTISEKLGLRLKDARILKERYSEEKLSKESSNRIREILDFPLQKWFENLESKLKEINCGPLSLQEVIFWGGGSKLPGFKEILQERDGKGIFITSPTINFLWPSELGIVSNDKKFLTDIQYTSSLLLYYAHSYAQKSY